MSDPTDAHSKLIINGEEFEESEAQEFIEAGRKVRELEGQYNTKLDNVWPEYGRRGEQLKKLEAELTEAKTQLTEFSEKRKEGTETPKDVVEAKEAARKLGIALNEDLESAGYVKKSDLDKYLAERDQNQKQVDQVLAEADKLEKEISGSDGRPKFNKRAVLAYASAYGYSDLSKAYEDMNDEDLKPWREAQVEARKPKGLKTLQGGQGKEPKTPTVNDDNFKEMLREALYGGNE